MLEQIKKRHQRRVAQWSFAIAIFIGVMILLMAVLDVFEIDMLRGYELLYAASLTACVLLMFLVWFVKIGHRRAGCIFITIVIIAHTGWIVLISLLKGDRLADGVLDAIFVFNAPVIITGLTVYISSTTVNRVFSDTDEYLDSLNDSLDSEKAKQQQETQILTELAGISEIVMAVNRSLHLEDVLTTANTALATVTAMEIVIIQPYDAASARLAPPTIISNLPSKLVELLGDGTDEASILGNVLRSRESSINESVQTSTDPVLQKIARLGIYTLLCIPLKAGTEVVGVVTLASRHPQKFRGRSKSTLMTATCEIGTAIRNAALYESEQQERKFAQTLCSISKEASHSLNRQDVFNTIAHRFKEIIGVEGCSLLLLNKEDGVLTVVASAGLQADKISGLQLPLAMLPDWHLINEGGHWVANSAQKVGVPPYIASVLDFSITSALAVPLSRGEEVIGTVAVFNKLDGLFTEEDARRLKTLASSVSSPVRNIQLFDDMARLVEERTAELRVERDRAEEAVAFKDKMLSMVSHDLRTPLGTIKGFTTTMQEYVGRLTPEKQSEYLYSISKATDRLESLIRDLIDLSRLGAGQLHIIKDQIVLKRTFDQLWQAVEWKNHRLVLNIADNAPAYVPADAERLLRVLVNLVQNAVKYTPHDTTITISVAREGDNLLIAVEDEGEGIPEEYHEKVFEHFHRGAITDNEKIQGTGLGLAICKGLIEIHGGHIWVENRPQGGCRFAFTLPLMEEELEGEQGE